MPNVADSRKQRLRTLEAQIRQNYEAFVQTGFALKEIRDDELFKEDGFETWDRYLRERVGDEYGIEQTQARKLIACAQVRTKLPDLSDTAVSENEEAEWSQKAVYEFARLAPRSSEGSGQPFDLDKLPKRDVERVAKKVIEHCEEEGIKPTATVVRQFVDEELGVDRSAQAKESKQRREEEEREAERRREEEEHPELGSHFNDLIWKLQQAAEGLREIDTKVFSAWKRSNRGLIKRLNAAWNDLVSLLEDAK